MAEQFTIVSPVDGRDYAICAYESPEAITEAARLAASAFRDWRAAPLSDRISAITSFVDQFCDDAEGLAELVSWQMGRPLKDADEAGFLSETAKDLLAAAPAALVDQKMTSDETVERRLRRAPLGVHVAICAWNFPVAMIAGIVVPALAAGNTVLFKHAPQTALIADKLNDAAVASGLPKGVFRSLHMTHPDAERLLGSGLIQSVQFIGSVAGGQAVNAAASGAFVTTALELGGKDAAYVRADADVEKAAAALVAGAFDNSGQSCCSVERVYVDARIHDQFIDAAVAAADEWVVGDPFDASTTMGPVVSVVAADRIRSHIDDAKRKGAVQTFNGNATHPDYPAYVAPSILKNVDHDMAVMRDETFGPVLPVMKVTSDDAALQLMDDTPYGLTAGVWTADRAVAEWFGDRLDVGLFYQNRSDHADPHLPWGGMRQSGLGRTEGPTAYEGVTQTRGFHFRAEC